MESSLAARIRKNNLKLKKNFPDQCPLNNLMPSITSVLVKDMATY
jgi:hypothetical protein